MLASELLAYIKVKKICGDLQDIDIKNISQDSRDIKEGTAFICIEGSQVDGHAFVEGARAKGASLWYM